jgi:hypothetical protein
MNIKILAQKGMTPSAKLLRDSLESLTNKKIFVTVNPSKIVGVTHLVRWGNPNIVPNFSGVEINTRDFIISCSKLNLSRILSSVKSDAFTTVKFSPLRETPSDFPVVIRETLNGYGGEGIKFVENLQDFRTISGNFYWTPFFETTSEYRVHIGDGKILRIFKKVPREDTEEEKYPIRVNETYRYSLRTNESKFTKLNQLSRELAEVLTKDSFLALDVGFSRELNKYVIFEGNTAPGLNENTAEVYGRFILEYFKK